MKAERIAKDHIYIHLDNGYTISVFNGYGSHHDEYPDTCEIGIFYDFKKEQQNELVIPACLIRAGYYQGPIYDTVISFVTKEQLYDIIDILKQDLCFMHYIVQLREVD